MARAGCQTEGVSDLDESAVLEEAIRLLSEAGARFAYLHGSRARGATQADSDIDVAAWFGESAPQSYEMLLPAGVDLLVLDRAPLELAGRVAQHGRLLLSHDEVARVRWESTTRKIYFDELPRITRAHREFSETIRRGR